MNWKTEKDKDKRHWEFYPKKWHQSFHTNRSYELVDYEEEETITFDYIKEKYLNSKKALMTKSKSLKKIKKHLMNLNYECMENQYEMMKCINELHNIALNKSVFNSIEEHIAQLIIVA